LRDSMEFTMAWTRITRRQYARRTARYASDMTDREWGLVQPFLPMPRRLGRPRSTDLREVVNALLYIATTGCQWRMLPKDFPPCSTVQRYFYEWRALGLWSRINHHLVMEARQLEGREASPTAGVIDSQSVKTTESGGIRGYDAGKKTKGRKRHIIVDTLGLMVGLMVHSADVQDRDGAPRSPEIHSLQVAMVAARLRRWWLRGRQAEAATEEDRALDGRDHQTLGQGERLRSPAAPMGGRADLRMAR
jgi:transposase